MTGKPLDGIIVVALEQAVAAPYCSSRLADAGARVIKVERPEGDFARGYDSAVRGESSYFVWINRGKESIALDLRQAGDKAQLQALIRRPMYSSRISPPARPAGWDWDRTPCARNFRDSLLATFQATVKRVHCTN